jgi:peptide methionine sulfoxide reductase MsrB
MKRTEIYVPIVVILGHVFDDGPKQEGTVNSLSVDFKE